MPASVLAGKIPKWRLDRLVHRACPVCEADMPETICRRPDLLVVAQCKACGMIYLPEIPHDEDLGVFYRNYGDYKEFLPGRKSWFRKILPIYTRDPFIELLEHSGGVVGRRLCEVGCSYGSFLSRARERGADVVGVELDEGALEHLRQNGLPASKTFDVAAKFDVVCAFQLIEHLTTPAQFVDRASRALQADGRLLLALPNGGEGEKVGPAWVGYRVDLEHLNYFNVASLSRLLTRYHLYVEHFWEYFQPNISRREQSGVAPTGWRRVAADLLNGLRCEPRNSTGTFVLCVLARKVAV
jgi:SAM-dependent methyltransferase